MRVRDRSRTLTWGTESEVVSREQPSGATRGERLGETEGQPGVPNRKEGSGTVPSTKATGHRCPVTGVTVVVVVVHTSFLKVSTTRYVSVFLVSSTRPTQLLHHLRGVPGNPILRGSVRPYVPFSPPDTPRTRLPGQRISILTPLFVSCPTLSRSTQSSSKFLSSTPGGLRPGTTVESQ